MHPRQQPDPALLRLAAAQDGVITLEQALGLGLSRHAVARLVRERRWTRLCPGLLLLENRSTGGPVPWRALAWGGVLVGGDRARLGGRAAAFSAGLIDTPPDDIDVWVTADAPVPMRRPTGPGTGGGSGAGVTWRFRRDRHGVRGRTSVGRPPRIRLEDAIVDLASDGDENEAIGLMTTALGRRLTSPARLTSVLDRRLRVPNRQFLTAVLRDAADGADSPLELRYLRTVERAHGLPTGERQVQRGRTRMDVLYRRWRLVVELDGRLGHSGADRFRDLERDNSATGDGLSTLRYGSADVYGRPCVVAAQVAHNLHLRGWPGSPTRCPDCRARNPGNVQDSAA